MKDAIRFLIVDDYSVVRKGLELLLKLNFENANVDMASSYDEALSKIESTVYDLVVLDVTMNGVEDLAMVEKMIDKRPRIKILVFTSHHEEKYGPFFAKSGAKGFANKEISDEKFVKIAKQILDDEVYFETDVDNPMNDKCFAEIIDSLSDREREVFNLMVKGYGSLEISNELDLHMSTVSTYKNRLFKKLNVKNIVELIEFSKQS
jgi:DNA-binding NarL/FixJ family response regulator